MNTRRDALWIAFASAICVAGGAQAKTITVGGSNADFVTIQAAVTAAQPGDQIKVRPGTYPEQVTIPAGKNKLTLRSEKALAAIIKAPPVMADPGDIVRINGAQNVTLQGFTISGPLPDALFCSVFARTGVRVDGGGSAAIRENLITEIRSANPALRGCQNGVGILVGRNFEAAVGSATIEKNTITKYQKGAIVVDNAGSQADIQHNQIIGDGPNPVIAQNGIQVSRGATADVEHNEVSGHIFVFMPPMPLSTGILLFQAGAVQVSHNDVHDNDYGIDAESGADGPVIDHNDIARSVADGLSLYDQSGADVNHNNISDSGGDGIFVDATATGNAITHNKSLNNAGFDAEDDSAGTGTGGTANFWDKNKCDNDNRGGALCDH